MKLVLSIGAILTFVGCNSDYREPQARQTRGYAPLESPLHFKCQELVAGGSYVVRCENSEVFCYMPSWEIPASMPMDCFKK